MNNEEDIEMLNEEGLEDEMVNEEPTNEKHYTTSSEDAEINEPEDPNAKARRSSKKLLKTAAKGLSTYFGGAAGGNAASEVNDSGVADPIYDKMADRINKNKLLRKAADKLDESGAVDAVDGALDAVNGNASKGAGKIAQAANKNASQGAKENASEKSKAKPGLPNIGNKASGGEGKADASKMAMNFLKKHPQVLIVCGVIVLVLLLLIIILSVLGGITVEEDPNEQGIVDSAYDFNTVRVHVMSNDGSESLNEVMFPDYVKGIYYYELQNKTDNIEAIKTLLVIYKSMALAAGNYNASSKDIYIASGSTGIPYCDIYFGCNISADGTVSSNAGLETDAQIPPMDESTKELINEAYNATIYQLLMPSGYNSVLTEYSYEVPTYDVNSIVELANNKSYEEIITEIYSPLGWEIYNLQKHTINYTYTDVVVYWWPIGSEEETQTGIYGGKPISTRVTSEYGRRTDPITGEKGTMHNGIDIGASCGVPVIATRGGTVTDSKYSTSCGNLVKIDHGDGTYSRYCHMEDGVPVSVGDTVVQGQKIGTVGTTGKSTGCHLHFEVWLGYSRENPLEYVSADNPRPASRIISGYAEGANNTQTVCLSLKQSGFSDEAVAALMTNINAESGFRTSALGDSGTSYGLCQWHNGRKEKLENHCGSQLNSVQCQIDYLLTELQSGYVGVHNTLLSNGTAWDMTYKFCHDFEVPANRETSCAKRADNSGKYYSYVTNGCK